MILKMTRRCLVSGREKEERELYAQAVARDVFADPYQRVGYRVERDGGSTYAQPLAHLCFILQALIIDNLML